MRSRPATWRSSRQGCDGVRSSELTEEIPDGGAREARPLVAAVERAEAHGITDFAALIGDAGARIDRARHRATAILVQEDIERCLAVRNRDDIVGETV